MTADEAFIHAIVDHQGDNLPRIAYADWLEEQCDPRHVYIIVENDAARTGDLSMLEDLAGGYDPVWVARISRPPVGICCERVRFRGSGPVLTSPEIDAFEDDAKQRDAKYGGHPEPLFRGLPSEYRAFVLNYNGGNCDEMTFPVPEIMDSNGFTAQTRFHFPTFGEQIPLEDPTGPWGLWLTIAWDQADGKLPRDCDKLLMRLDREHAGRIYFLSHSYYHI